MVLYVVSYYMLIYVDLCFYVVGLIGVCMLILGISLLIADTYIYLDKSVGYECGFDPFSDAREPFSIKYYLIAIMYIIFDIEIMYFVPWILGISQLSYIGFYIMYVFFWLLLLGFIFEWKKRFVE